MIFRKHVTSLWFCTSSTPSQTGTTTKLLQTHCPWPGKFQEEGNTAGAVLMSQLLALPSLPLHMQTF